MTVRKDDEGHILRKGETKRENYYVYQYTDIHRRRRSLYAKSLPELREKERQLLQDIRDGLDIAQRADLTLNDAFDRYYTGRTDLKRSSRLNYEYLYDRYVRDGFGTWKLAKLCYSDFRIFYSSLAAEYGLSKKTLLLIHSILNQVLKVAVRDNIIRSNPAEGVIQDLSKKYGWEERKRHALTPEEQSILLQYAIQHAEYELYVPLLILLLGTGCRIGEALGLRWREDVDFDSGIISVTHSLQYRKLDSGRTGFYISTPKTTAGTRTIPMISQVREALLLQKERQDTFIRNQKSFRPPTVDGYSGFVFLNRRGGLFCATDVNRAIKSIVQNYNKEELLAAKKDLRAPLLLPDISCHHLRHTFCSRLCENETNLKIIQDIMGHASITTTMNRYAEATERKKAERLLHLENKLLVL